MVERDEQGNIVILCPRPEDIVFMHCLVPRRPTRVDPDDRGVHNQGAIEAACARCLDPSPASASLATRAALLLRGICQDHPFINANKRTALVSTGVFLRMNDINLVLSRKEAVQFMLDVAQNVYSLEEIAFFIATHVEKIEPFQWGSLRVREKAIRRSNASWRFRRDVRTTRSLL